jgi:hypothetical protein
MSGQELEGRRGRVFAVRMTDDERAELQRLHEQTGGPRAFGPWILWRALGTTAAPGTTAAARNTRARGSTRPGQWSVGNTGSSAKTRVIPPPAIGKRIVLDLCAGSGAWSEPYREAGYKVVRVTLPRHDVRTFAAPRNVWGVLAAPPCDQFSLARNGHKAPRDFARGLEVVSACLRIIMQARPAWWALENPVGLLAQWLGKPRDVFEPCDFGDPWTKRTALWGDFVRPNRHHVKPVGPGPFCERCDPSRRRSTACTKPEHRAMTPPGFARAFFLANP